MNNQSASNRNEKQMALTGFFIQIGTFFISFTSAIPSELKGNVFFKIGMLLIIILGSMLMFPFLSEWFKGRSKIVRFSTFGLAILFTLFLIASVFTNVRSSKTLAQANIITKTVSNQNSSIIENTHDTKIDLSNSKNPVIGNGNVININQNVHNGNVYNKAPQRNLNQHDLKMLVDTIPSKDARVRINYLEGNPEAANFAKQIFDRLIQLGYTNLSIGTVNGSSNYLKAQRINVYPEKFPSSIINLIINAQS